MAMMAGDCRVSSFEDWYDEYRIDERNACLDRVTLNPMAQTLWQMFTRYKSEMDQRVRNYDKLERLADGQVLSPKPDLPNISSGETAGLVRRMSRNLVQNCPNVEVICKYDDDSTEGIFIRHILTSKIIGSDEYSNDMQQNLFASTKTALTLGFDTIVPVLLQDAGGGWYMKYDSIHYRDVFPEPGARDIRQANVVFVRRYLTQADVHALIREEAVGWDPYALKTLLMSVPYGLQVESAPFQSKKSGQVPEGYEIITWYSNTGEPFLTFSSSTRHLLRIERNKHPLKQHPVHFLVLEKDSQQPLGKSQVELIMGRQDFQDLMLNGAMKLWYRNINPSIIGFGSVNATPNLSPGKFTQISNPNARIEPFEVNTQTLMQYSAISEQNLGSMVNLVGSADQQMAVQAGNGMSATPQGVDAQQQMVDITTNNYQKAIEAFFSHYCSYALTIYFQELRATKKVKPTAEARLKLLRSGLAPELLNEDGTIDLDFEKLATEYWVRVVPGSLVEMEDEKQLRILNALFVPLSQSMPALAATENKKIVMQAAAAMQYIIEKQIELSGAAAAKDIRLLWRGEGEEVQENEERLAMIEEDMSAVGDGIGSLMEMNESVLRQLQDQIHMLRESQGLILERLGGNPNGNATPQQVSNGPAPTAIAPGANVMPAQA